MIDPNPDVVVGIALVSSAVTMIAVAISALGRRAASRARQEQGPRS